MKCRVVRRHIGDYLDGTLSAPLRDAVREHTSCCPHCRAVLAEARRVRDILCGAAFDVAPPPGLAERIKLRAAQVQEEAQIRARPSSAAVGSPAFVATCASVFMGAVMCYIVVTQFYLGGLDAAIGVGSPVVVAQAPVDVAPAAPAPAVTGPATRPAGPAAAVEQVAARPRDVETRAIAPARTRHAVADVARRLVDTGRDAGLPATASPAAAGPAAPPPARPAVAVAAALPAPARLASAAVARAAEATKPLVDGPVDHIASAGAKDRSQVKAASADEASRGVVAGLVAGYVVERYVVDRIIQAEPTLLALTTSTPSSTGTALTERTKQ